jgi:hypothetical protein
MVNTIHAIELPCDSAPPGLGRQFESFAPWSPPLVLSLPAQLYRVGSRSGTVAFNGCITAEARIARLGGKCRCSGRVTVNREVTLNWG